MGLNFFLSGKKITPIIGSQWPVFARLNREDRGSYIDNKGISTGFHSCSWKYNGKKENFIKNPPLKEIQKLSISVFSLFLMQWD